MPNDGCYRAALEVPGAGTEEPAVAYVWNLATDTLAWGPTLADAIPFADDEAFATGLGYAGFLAPDSTSSRYEAIVAGNGCDTGGGVAFQVTYGLTPDARTAGTTTWIEDKGRWFADANGRPGLVQGSVRSITERYEAERLLASAAQRDPATGAYTNGYFREHIERHLLANAQKRTSFAILLVEVSAVKHGARTDAGPLQDQLTAAVIALVGQQMRTNEIMGRDGESRFALLLENCSGEQMAAAAARLVAAVEGGLSPTAKPMAKMRLGGVVAPLHGRTAADLLQHAAEALEVGAPDGTASFVPYDPGRPWRTERRMSSMADEIVAALNDRRVVLALQPVVDAATRQTIFCEGLVRVRQADGTLLMPDLLVPAAESAGIVALLDRRVVDLAFAHLAADPCLALSINASVTSLHDPSWQEHCRAACRLDRNAARRLTVEVTETCAVADLDATRTVLLALKQMGVTIAIDDFGSGHSSFRNLRSLPIDYLKIDGAFVRDLAHSVDAQFFVRTLVDLANNLQIPTVAEWVEDEATAQMLAASGITLLQGHLFGRAEVPREAEPMAALA